MHVEVPKKGALASFKAFAGEYAMIVISILTALALEHAAQAWHHRHLAHEAEQRIQAELAENLKELREATQHNAAQLKRLEALRDLMRDAVIARNENSGPELKARLMELRDKMNGLTGGKSNKFGIKTPTLRREAWEVAVASQAASWIDTARLQRLSAAYAQQRDAAPFLTSSVNMIASPEFNRIQADVELHKDGNTDQYYMLAQMCASLHNVLQTIQGLESAMEAGTKGS